MDSNILIYMTFIRVLQASIKKKKKKTLIKSVIAFTWLTVKRF